MGNLSYSIDGRFITDLALEKFYYQNDFSAAVNLLKSSLVNPEIPESEIVMTVMRILNKEMRIEGAYPSDNYGVAELTAFDPNFSHISKHISELSTKLEKNKTLADNYQTKFEFIQENLTSSEKIYLNELYKENFQETLFSDSPFNKTLDTVLADFIEHAKCERDDDYGWLEPDGTFHPVKFAEHEEFAVNFLKEHYPFDDEKHTPLYYHSFAADKPEYISGGDVLIYSLGWILLHNPTRGTATAEHDPAHRITAKQKEFLTEYYTMRNLPEKLNEILSQ